MSFRRPAGSFRLWGEEEKENGGRHSPFLLSRRRPSAEKSLRLGAKGTEEQGFAGIHALSPRRRGRGKVPETWCKGNGRTRFCGGSCTKSVPAERRKGPETWCKGNERTRLCGNSCTKSAPAGRRHLPPIRSVAGATSKNNKKTSNLSCSFVVRDQGFEPWTP